MFTNVQILTQQPDFQTARKYWNKLKERLGKEGSQLVTNCHRFKPPANDGKMRLTDDATAETLNTVRLRIFNRR
jgi:DNA-damage-inducible protein D